VLQASVWKSALKPVLETGLNSIYEQMHSGDETKDDAWLAGQVAELLASAITSTGTDQIKTAGVPVGAVVVTVTGQAAGVQNTAEITVV